jgi:hypothetical protein
MGKLGERESVFDGPVIGSHKNSPEGKGVKERPARFLLGLNRQSMAFIPAALPLGG